MGIIFIVLNLIFIPLSFYTKNYKFLFILVLDLSFIGFYNPWAKIKISKHSIVENEIFYKKEILFSDIKMLELVSNQKGMRFISQEDLNKNPLGVNQIFISKVYYKKPPDIYLPIPNYNYIVFDYSKEAYQRLERNIKKST